MFFSRPSGLRARSFFAHTCLLTGSLLALGLSGCKKDGGDPLPKAPATEQILTDFADKVAFPTYSKMETEAEGLRTAVTAFVNEPTEARLQDCRQRWFAVREAWEMSEAFLFGPVATDNLDPAVDDWPVNRTDLDSVLNNTSTYTTAYVAGLATNLKGFHAIEFLLFGHGNRPAAQMTEREKSYLLHLTEDLKNTTTLMRQSWDPGISSSFRHDFTAAGTSASQYGSKRAAIEELVNDMAGIVEEVSAGKLNEPFVQRDSTLEESHFSKNSFVDFANNIRGVKNVYLGKYQQDGAGLHDYVITVNRSLDAKLVQQMDDAINVFTSFSMPFGNAIYSQPDAIRNAQRTLDQLHATLEDELLPLVQTRINE